MYKLLQSLKVLLKWCFQSVVIDDSVFRLHYQVTLLFLVVFGIVVGCRQYFGDPIDCIARDDIPSSLLDTFCWIHSTFSVEDAWFKKVGVEIPYPGVGKYTPGEVKRYHAYYQWVCYVLFLQAFLMYLPRYLWKRMESGKMEAMLEDTNIPFPEEDRRRGNLKLLVDCVMENFNHNQVYAALYFLAEVLNAANAVGQMYLMNRFLGGVFLTYGIEVLRFTDWDYSLRYDPMIRVFPRLAKCSFHRYGRSGDVQRHDAMCLLPINIVNEKIYVFLWFWFVVLACVSCVAVVYRVVLFASPRVREVSLKCRVTQEKGGQLDSVLRRCRMGDWFVVSLLHENLRSRDFKDFVSILSRRLDREDDIDVESSKV